MEYIMLRLFRYNGGKIITLLLFGVIFTIFHKCIIWINVISHSLTPNDVTESDVVFHMSSKNSTRIDFSFNKQYKNATWDQMNNMSNILKCTTIGDDILRAKPLEFFRDVKNPCFGVHNGYYVAGIRNVTEAILKGYSVKCLPYAFVAGFPKCGTSSLFYNMVKLRYLQGATSSMKKLPIKELHFWDNHNCLQNYSLLSYANKFDTGALMESFTNNGYMDRQVGNLQDHRDMIFLDGTPRLIFHGDDWLMDSGNKGLVEPKILLPHKLHHVLPKAKIILLLRNPTDRLLSDYKFYFRYGNQSADDFHDKVVAAISWWNSCKQVAPLKACLYGSAPASLPELDLRNCFMRNQPEDVPNKCKYWHKEWSFCRNAASRLRVGLYDLHIEEWMKIYPKDSFLFIRSDDLARDPVTVYNVKILPFLNHPPLTKKEISRITKVSMALVSNSSVKMLPMTRQILNEFYLNTKRQLVEITDDRSFMWEDSK